MRERLQREKDAREVREQVLVGFLFLLSFSFLFITLKKFVAGKNVKRKR
jgi:hypothetical protein